MNKKIIGIFIVMLLITATLPNISGKYLERNQKDVESIDINLVDNEIEYWGVCVVAFDGPYDDVIEPFIYDSLLEAENWDKSHIKLLFRENATRTAIINALDWLIENADENDVVLFSDHSHGTFRRADEKYGIIPIDSETSGIITVDELDEKFDTIKAKELCLIFDCCLAGSFVDKGSFGIDRIDKMRFLNKGFTKGLEGDNRIVLMGTMRYGLGINMYIYVSGGYKHLSFHKFVGEAFNEKIDYNSDGFCSAEEAFRYAKKKWLPYAIMAFFMIRVQIQTLLTTGFFIIPFPTIYDNIQGELPISKC